MEGYKIKKPTPDGNDKKDQKKKGGKDEIIN